MYDAITPAQWVIGLAISLGAFGGLAWLLWHYSPRDMGARDMSTAPVPAVRESVPDPVHVPVPPTSTALAPAEPAKPVPADTDAPNGGAGWELPRVSRTLSDRDIIITLAVQRAGGKYRFSANQIHGLAGGPRADVLALVKLVREGPAEHRPLSPEQQSARVALGLDKKEAVTDG